MASRFYMEHSDLRARCPFPLLAPWCLSRAQHTQVLSEHRPEVFEDSRSKPQKKFYMLLLDEDSKKIVDKKLDLVAGKY